MIKLTDLTLYCNKEFKNSSELVASQGASLGYAYQLQGRVEINVIKHASFQQSMVINNVRFDFFTGSNRFGFLSFQTIKHLLSSPPDMILLQGLIYPVQVLLLRLIFGKKLIIVAQHHGELPWSGYKGRLQRWADKFTRAYLFTSLGNSTTWLENKIIGHPGKCYEILEASTNFLKQDKDLSKSKTGLNGEWNFLWVGRLNANKDPLTVLRGFEKYLTVNPLAKLYMIFHTEEMFKEIKEFITNSAVLPNAVFLRGKVEHLQLQYWYSAADFFISGSHREGSGFALIEAMCCGCLPVITNIPTFRKISGDGEFAFLYEAGDSEGLFQTLKKLTISNREEMSGKIIQHFKTALSFEGIAEKLFKLVSRLFLTTENSRS